MWANSLAGWRPGEKIAMLWGSDRDFRGALRSFRLEARWRIENVRWFNAFDMGDDRMEEFDRALTRFRPFLLVAYAGSAQRFARFLADRGRRPSYPNGAIVASAEMLTPAMREDIQAVFGRPVYDRYGNREMGALAAECCAHDGLHINESDAIVEIDSQDPYRVPGPILVTYLHNFCMPFIRYDTGDLGVLRTADACPCGRTTARLAAVVGRQSDTIRTATGNLVHGEFFTHLLYGADGVREFQFVQETLTHYTLRLVADRARTAQHEDRWRREMLSVLGGDVALRIDYVDSIPVLPSGKRKFTLSLVQGELHQR
jgi:phenylacetate-CoA ligase